MGVNDCSHLLLVVDDDPDMRDAISELLEGEGYRVVRVENGRAALEILRAGGRPSMILLDMMMPVMSGWQFRREQQRDPSIQRIPVVMITASEERRGDLIPNQQVLTKPVRADELLKSVHRYC
jgi:CheY-like chemotaxis protein